MESLLLNKYEIFIKKFDHFPARLLFNERTINLEASSNLFALILVSASEYQ